MLLEYFNADSLDKNFLLYSCEPLYLYINLISLCESHFPCMKSMRKRLFNWFFIFIKLWKIAMLKINRYNRPIHAFSLPLSLPPSLFLSIFFSLSLSLSLLLTHYWTILLFELLYGRFKEKPFAAHCCIAASSRSHRWRPLLLNVPGLATPWTTTPKNQTYRQILQFLII